MALHVRIDRVTQGTEDHQTPADRLSVNSEDFLWIYVEAELPSGAGPKGEYLHFIGDVPDPGTRKDLDPPVLVDGQYRFGLIHYVLSRKSRYLFRFADDLVTPHYHDQWEVVTV